MEIDQSVGQKAFITRRMESKPFHMAPVEIIIPFHGETTRVSNLMDSIFKTVHTTRYLITLVDDGSVNKSFIKDIDRHFSKPFRGVRCFQQKEQKGFGAAVNLALANPWSDKITWVAIMQSDVLVSDNRWLSNLGECLNRLKSLAGQSESDPLGSVKMVSPMTDNPMIESEKLAEKFIGKKGDIRPDHVLTEGYLPMYCVLAHRELFKKVGPLIEKPYASIEAEDYAVRMRLMGYKQAVCGSSWVHHEGGLTLARYKDNTRVQEMLRKIKEEFDPGPKKEVLPG